MSDPIFRYVLVLLAIFVVFRILLKTLADKQQEQGTQTDEMTKEAENGVGQTGDPQIEQVVIPDDQNSDSKKEKTDYE